MIDLISYPQPSADTLPPPEAPADARELLSRFATTGEQEPFEEVVRRYGGMVYNLCYEVTGNRHDAEDAVQAAFMSLALQVRAGQQIQAIGPWLQQVARRMSLDINRSRKRRKNREDRHGKAWEARQLDASADASGGSGAYGNPASAAGWEELRHVVQAELNEMPAKYRMPLILHYYGGMSREEMARELNCRANTLGVRLHRGREMLGKRLAKRGITLSGVMFGLIMGEVVHSVVSQRLIEHTAQAAVLVSSGHPFACGVVSPQVVAMAHTASRALANAKVKLAATLALLAGGAAAAGAQVVSHTGMWSVPRTGNFDLSRAFKWLLDLPSWRSGPMLTDKDAGTSGGRNGSRVVPSPSTGAGPGAPQVANSGVPTSSFPLQPYRSFDLSINPVPRLSPGAAPQSWTSPPVARGGQAEAPLPFPPRNAETFTLNRGFGPVNVGRPDESGIASGGSGTTVDPIVPTPDRVQPGSGTANGRPPGSRSPQFDPNPWRPISGGGVGGTGDDIAQRPKTNPQKFPTGGGVKPTPNNTGSGSEGGNGNGPSKPGSTNHAPQDVPDTFDPGEIAPLPRPVPGDPKGAPFEPPVIGPVVPPPQPNLPTPPPGKPTGDANGVEDTPAAPPSTSAPGGGGHVRGGYLSESGDLYVTTPFNAAGAESFDQVLAGGVGNALLQMDAGTTLVSKSVLVGHLGAGVATQAGGAHTVDSLYLGVAKGARGQYGLTGGELRVTASPTGPDSPIHSVEIGGAGDGVFLLGNATSTGQLVQAGEGGGVNLTVAATRSAKGTLRGWGQIQLKGQLTNNGQIIADGYGQDRGLDLSSFAAVFNDRANRTTNGWYAVNHGKLELPALAVSKATPRVTWGQASDDDALTYVNSARLTFTGAQTDAQVKVALLALDRADVPTLPQGHVFLSAWSFDAGGLDSTGGMDLLVRYDDALAAAKGLDENLLKLWRYADGQWERLDHDPTFVRDPINHTLLVHTGIDGMTHFAVSAPEPGTFGLVMVVGGLWLGARRRRQ